MHSCAIVSICKLLGRHILLCSAIITAKGFFADVPDCESKTQNTMRLFYLFAWFFFLKQLLSVMRKRNDSVLFTLSFFRSSSIFRFNTTTTTMYPSFVSTTSQENNHYHCTMFWTPLRPRTILLPSQSGILGRRDDSPIIPRRYERDENDDQEPIDTTPTTTGSPMMKCETPPGISYRPSLIENENDPRTVQDPSWYRDDLSSLGYIESGFWTPTSTTTTKILNKPHRRQSVLIDSTQRPAWNSPDVMDVEWKDSDDVNKNDIDVLSQHHLRHDQEETVTTRMVLSLPQRDPPPPPSPSRRICFVSLDNFTPTPVFGVNFRALSPPSRPKEQNQKNPFHQSKRLKLCPLDVDDDDGHDENNKRPKLTMKRTRYQEALLEGKGSTSFIPIPSYPSTLRW